MTDIVADMTVQQFKSTICIAICLLCAVRSAYAVPHIGAFHPIRKLYVTLVAQRQSHASSPIRIISTTHSDSRQCVPGATPTTTPTPTTEASISVTPTISLQTTPTPTTLYTPIPNPTTTPTPYVSPTPTSTPTSTSPSVVLTEIMPAPTSPNPEWIEVYNPTNTAIDLTGWHIDDIENGGSAPQALSGTVAPHGYTIVELKSAIFNNSGDDVRLLDPTDTVVSKTSYTTSSSTESWGLDMNNLLFCAQLPTPGTPNRTPCTSQTVTPTLTTPQPSPTVQQVTPTPSPTPTSAITPTPTVQAATRVFISEFLPRPTTGTAEWVELYNDSDNAASLDNWYIDDLAGGGSSPKQITVSIAAHSYASIQLTSAILNNDSDSVRLLDPQQQMVDELHYEDAEVDISFSRHDYTNDTVCKTVPTPVQENNSCIDVLTSASSQSDAPTPTPTPAGTGADDSSTIATAVQSPAPVTTILPGDIRGISTYRLDSSQPTLHNQAPVEPLQKHSKSRMAFALASITSSGAALLLFLRKIKPW